jgi:hypothetical protein
MSSPRLIAFYLPQFHPIPENDEWWGKGFTEWRNVVTAKPRFRGHYQPHIPADLGFYDLRNEETRIAQAELAKAYGIYGFCYHHYWFNGKMLLERPFNEVLSSGKPDFPFCLCWANENWTRRWDGQDDEILVNQDYDNYNASEHMAWLNMAFSDKRYIKVNGKPLFLIYKTDGISNLPEKIKIWKTLVCEMGYRGLYLCSVSSYKNTLTESEAINLGFDAIVDFKPNGRDLPHWKYSMLSRYYFNRLLNRLVSWLKLDRRYRMLPISLVFDYEAMVSNIINRPPNKGKVFPCVMPSWDNSPRCRVAAVIQNENPEIYRKWLEFSLRSVSTYPADERIVFINAWNEWAEGCHLEPDLKNGRKFLEATAKAISSWQGIISQP